MNKEIVNNQAIVIVGGGPVGATLALALARKGVAATLLEARTKGAGYPDGRALALSYGTKMILERLGVWDTLSAKVTAINTIHVSQKGSFGRSILKAHEHDLPSLGYVVSYGLLSAALDHALLDHTEIQIQYETEVTSIEPNREATLVNYQTKDDKYAMQAKLAALADGGRSLNDIVGFNREVKEYGDDALVAKVSTGLHHQNIAYERFTSQGPMALLPNRDEFSLVWTGKSAEIQTLLALDDATFLAQLHAHFGDRVGQFTHVGKRMTFPLKLATLSSSTAPHLAVIGNAAQTMHPVAGQGFNVGLRDAFELAEQILASDPDEYGSEKMLKAYQHGRQTDTHRGLLFTDFLVNAFSSEMVGLPTLRSVGLGLFDLAKPLKKKLVNKMSFGSHG